MAKKKNVRSGKSPNIKSSDNSGNSPDSDLESPEIDEQSDDLKSFDHLSNQVPHDHDVYGDTDATHRGKAHDHQTPDGQETTAPKVDDVVAEVVDDQSLNERRPDNAGRGSAISIWGLVYGLFGGLIALTLTAGLFYLAWSNGIIKDFSGQRGDINQTIADVGLLQKRIDGLERTNKDLQQVPRSIGKLAGQVSGAQASYDQLSVHYLELNKQLSSLLSENKQLINSLKNISTRVTKTDVTTDLGKIVSVVRHLEDRIRLIEVKLQANNYGNKSGAMVLALLRLLAKVHTGGGYDKEAKDFARLASPLPPAVLYFATSGLPDNGQVLAQFTEQLANNRQISAAQTQTAGVGVQGGNAPIAPQGIGNKLLSFGHGVATNLVSGLNTLVSVRTRDQKSVEPNKSSAVDPRTIIKQALSAGELKKAQENWRLLSEQDQIGTSKWKMMIDNLLKAKIELNKLTDKVFLYLSTN